MQRVTCLGGLFFKSHLGLDISEWGGAVFRWADESPSGTTLCGPFKADTDFMAPSTAPFMVNFRVADLHALFAALRTEGCDVLDKVDESDYGKFGWAVDPEGHKVELREPPTGR
jgi:predicted enzyme related to lactoylglutathione lyase